MEIVLLILAVVVASTAAFLFGQIYATRIRVSKRIREAEQESQKIKRDALADAENLKKEKLIEVQDEWYRKRQEFDERTKLIKSEVKAQQDDLARRERSVEQKGDLINRKEKDLIAREGLLSSKMDDVQRKQQQLDSLIQSQNAKLEQIARMTVEEAKQVLMNNLIDQAKQEAAQSIRNIKEQAQLTAKDEVKHVLIQAMQRAGLEYVVDGTATAIKLPSNEMKGRIIGREGRNIRAFETLTGCEVLIDDTPNTILVSCFDPIRREIAKVALESLIADGRIHPGRIEDLVEKARRDLDEQMMNYGEQAFYEAGVHGTHPELVKMTGKLKFRHAYGMNLLQHSVETSAIAGMIAAEMGLDPQMARRAGILHDIGYAVDRSDQPHTIAGAELVRKYGEAQVIQNAILHHHDDPPFAHPLSIVVHAANRLSKERPGAKKESLENYIKRLNQLEQFALSFNGVSQAYAVQAGREVRVLVDCAAANDNQAIQVADDIAHKIENDLQYPGQIKVTVIREYRAVDFAK